MKAFRSKMSLRVRIVVAGEPVKDLLEANAAADNPHRAIV
jgi:hypothetical protein